MLGAVADVAKPFSEDAGVLMHVHPRRESLRSLGARKLRQMAEMVEIEGRHVGMVQRYSQAG